MLLVKRLKLALYSKSLKLIYSFLLMSRTSSRKLWNLNLLLYFFTTRFYEQSVKMRISACMDNLWISYLFALSFIWLSPISLTRSLYLLKSGEMRWLSNAYMNPKQFSLYLDTWSRKVYRNINMASCLLISSFYNFDFITSMNCLMGSLFFELSSFMDITNLL